MAGELQDRAGQGRARQGCSTGHDGSSTAAWRYCAVGTCGNARAGQERIEQHHRWWLTCPGAGQAGQGRTGQGRALWQCSLVCLVCDRAGGREVRQGLGRQVWIPAVLAGLWKQGAGQGKDG